MRTQVTMAESNTNNLLLPAMLRPSSTITALLFSRFSTLSKWYAPNSAHLGSTCIGTLLFIYGQRRVGEFSALWTYLFPKIGRVGGIPIHLMLYTSYLKSSPIFILTSLCLLEKKKRDIHDAPFS